MKKSPEKIPLHHYSIWSIETHLNPLESWIHSEKTERMIIEKLEVS